MTKRKTISKKIRFEVFKRDSFTCQYCGKKAPDTILQLDHINPVFKKGKNDLLNLVTSCFDCNSGKSDRTLSDTTVLDVKRKQLEALQIRKEQLEMMFEWQKSLLDLEEIGIQKLSAFWSENVKGYHLNESGLQGLRKLNKKFNPSEIMEAIKTSSNHYLQYDEEGNISKDSVEAAWSKIGGICSINRVKKDNPAKARLYYIRGILRKRMYCCDWQAMNLLTEALELGADIDKLEEAAKDNRNWTSWKAEMEYCIETLSGAKA